MTKKLQDSVFAEYIVKKHGDLIRTEHHKGKALKEILLTIKDNDEEAQFLAYHQFVRACYKILNISMYTRLNKGKKHAKDL